MWFLQFYFLGLLTLAAGVLGLSAGCAVLLGKRWPEEPVGIARVLMIILGVWGLLAAALSWNTRHDVTHLFWAVQIPLVALFLTSGVFLSGTWLADHEPGESRPAFGALTFLALTFALSVEPLVLQELSPLDPTQHRVSGAPTRAVLQLAAWSFGGDLPDCLVPLAQAGFERGVGFPPRDVTVPMGSLLIAAWTTIVFVLFAFAVRCLRSRHARLVAYVTLPPGLGTVFLFVKSPIGPFEPGFFGPDSTFRSGIWMSDPLVMRSFGFVLAAAALFAAALVVAVVREREAAYGPHDNGRFTSSPR